MQAILILMSLLYILGVVRLVFGTETVDVAIGLVFAGAAAAYAAWMLI